jgi:VCBS repeat-containing protein
VQENNPTNKVSNTLTVSDVDSEVGFNADTQIGTYGTFTLVPDAQNLTKGTWTYTLDNTNLATQALQQGTTETESFTVTSSDGSASLTIEVNVVGSNDKPFIKDANGNPVAANPVMAGANEDDAAFSITTAQLLANTGDYEGDTLTVSNLTLQSTNDNGQPNNDGVTIINGNSLSVNPSAYDYLADGESEVIEYRYTVSDGFASSNVIQTVKITITGSNDGATISVGQGDSAFEIVQEDDPNALNANDELEIQGTLSISDPDRGESLFQSGAATFDPNTSTNNAELGSLTITEGGEWTYAIDNDQLAVQELGANDTFTETFTVTSQDGSDSQSISVQVTGTNDEATIVDSNDVAVTQPSPSPSQKTTTSPR